MKGNNDNKYTNNLDNGSNRENKSSTSEGSFYQTLTLTGIGLILAGVYTVVIVLFSPVINAAGSIPFDIAGTVTDCIFSFI